MTFIDDYALVGFWPLHEPSGTPYWHNYSPRMHAGLSGQLFDFRVTRSTERDENVPRAKWPGLGSHFVPESGITHTGLQLHGRWEQGDQSRWYATKQLICGDGNFSSRRFGIPPDVAQSGFTVGLWVMPTSDGWWNGIETGGIASSEQTDRYLGRVHSLLARCTRDNGFFIGISGQQAGATQFASEKDGGPHQLRAYLHGLGGEVGVGGGVDSTHISTPIESGRPTHLTFVHRVENPATDLYSYAFYKDGHLVGSGQITESTESHKMVATTVVGASHFADTPLCLGGVSDETTTSTDSYNRSTGWGHLVSGVYWFERPLWDAEVEALHNAGGLQIDEGTAPLIGKEKAVELTDPHLLAYYPFQSPGYPDVSRHHHPLIFQGDEAGQGTTAIATPGPFDRGGVTTVLNNATFALGTSSGVANALLASNGSFSIGFFACPDATTVFARDQLCSLGALGSTEAPNLIDAIGGWQISTGNVSNVTKQRVRFFELGSNDVELRQAQGDRWRRTYSHYGIVYDVQTQGVAYYIDGLLQESGTLSENFSLTVRGLLGSGYPIYFLGGVQGTSTSLTAPDAFLSNGGLDNSISDIAMFTRPIEQQEMRYLAVSGIDTTILNYTVHDPRLRGYWKGDEETHTILQDRCTLFQDLQAPLVACASQVVWQAIIYDGGESDTLTPFFPTDWFSRVRETPPELASFGNLGVTSGAWVVQGGSKGAIATNVSPVVDRKSSYANIQNRFAVAFEDRNQQGQHHFEEYIHSFEVTPSGFIPAIYDPWSNGAGAFPGLNSLIFVNHKGTSDAFACWLTSINANNPDPAGQDAGTGPSGVTIVWGATDGGTSIVATSISGNLVFGVPNRVLFHCKPLNPYQFENLTPPPHVLSVYIGGVMVDRRVIDWDAAMFVSDSSPNLAARAWRVEFGGISINDAQTAQITDRLSGLGDIYLRNMFIMRGRFTQTDVDTLAANGIIDNPSIGGYINNQGRSVTSVSVTHPDLETYCRFAGGESGAIDLSSKQQPLTHLARIIIEDGTDTWGSFGSAATADDNAGTKMRYLPGPLAANDLGIQSSGITYAGDQPSLDALAVAPFVASGTPFTRPDLGFTIAFWYSMRDDNGSSEVKIPISFGGVPNVHNTTQNRDCSWAIVYDAGENFVMHLSIDGTMHLDPNGTTTERAGSRRCGMYHSKGFEFDRTLDQTKKGSTQPAHLDSLSHYAWAYDPAGLGSVRGYLNGVMITEICMDGHQLRIPTDPTLRMISLMSPQTTPWLWDATELDDDGVLTDFAYFSAPLTDAEIRSIAFNGIVSPFSVAASGIIGGFSLGQDTGSGIVGVYARGQDEGSGIIGGFGMGSTPISGIIGGFSSGVVVTTGLIGGYMRALDEGSGLWGGMVLGSILGSGMVAGYLQGLATNSGIFGGHVFAVLPTTDGSGMFGGMSFGSILGDGFFGGMTIGGLTGGPQDFDAYYVVEGFAKRDFDAQLEATTSLSSEFDAKVIIFQEEAPPLVEIIIPGKTVEGLVPPFNQYFIGKASGTQDKTITKTIWNFGDLTPVVEVAESGAGCYPVQHSFATSGFYVVRFTAIDSDGIHNSAMRFVNAASGIPEALISLSGVPQIGEAALSVAFDMTIEALPDGVTIVSDLLTYDDGQTTTTLNPTHDYTEPGIYRPVWCVRDSRGFIWCDSLDPGIDFLK